ncbi:MAG TPA: DUF5335 family protein [Candidatus Binatia bacterium]|nr:DUF5335 family protein [Candidatus Binatia bacterium]
MFTQEIPRAEWRPFFDDFSLRHEGWIVSVEIMGRDIGDQEQARRPLAGVSAEIKDRIARIEISVGNLLDGHVVHIIEAPARVWCKSPMIPGDEAIEIEDGDGRKTLVTFVRIGVGQTDRQLPES